MKKVIACFTATLLLVSLVACSGTINRVEQPLNSSIPESTGKDLEHTEQSLFDEAGIKAQFEQVVNTCSGVADNLVIDMEKSAFPMPTQEEYMQMHQAIGALGFPVSYYNFDMPNYEKVEAFWNDVQAGRDAQAVIYCLYNWGITADILVHRNGEDFRTMAVYDFPQSNANGKSEISFEEPVHKIDELHMTEKGYLLYQIPEQDGFSEMHGGYRVSPLGEENRALGRKYIENIGYIANGMLRYDWNKDDFSELNLNWVFESLYYQLNGDFPGALYTGTDENGRIIVPAKTMEDIMLTSLPLSEEQLRSSILFHETNQVYAYESFAGGGYSPLPEVVNATTNTDGSLSLTIDAVAIEFGEDKSMQSILTVMDNPDGSIRYISNVVVTPFGLE